MDEGQAPKTTESAYGVPDGDGLLDMMRTFYSKPMLPTVLFIWFWALVFMAAAVLCAVFFFRTDETRLQIAYAAGFICLIQSVGMMKIFAWQMIHRLSIKRAIRRLEDRIEACCKP